MKCNETITANTYVYTLQMDHEKLLEKCPALVNRKSVILLHDNAELHMTKVTQEKILGAQMVYFASYSPDLAPWTFFNGKTFTLMMSKSIRP
jgi:hypothetical protein